MFWFSAFRFQCVYMMLAGCISTNRVSRKSSIPCDALHITHRYLRMLLLRTFSAATSAPTDLVEWNGRHSRACDLLTFEIGGLLFAYTDSWQTSRAIHPVCVLRTRHTRATNMSDVLCWNSKIIILSLVGGMWQCQWSFWLNLFLFLYFIFYFYLILLTFRRFWICSTFIYFKQWSNDFVVILFLLQLWHGALRTRELVAPGESLGSQTNRWRTYRWRNRKAQRSTGLHGSGEVLFK